MDAALARRISRGWSTRDLLSNRVARTRVSGPDRSDHPRRPSDWAPLRRACAALAPLDCVGAARHDTCPPAAELGWGAAEVVADSVGRQGNVVASGRARESTPYHRLDSRHPRLARGRS